MNRKYEFTGETKKYYGRILHRIKRIEDDLVGGWIESEKNLSQEGSCFVYNEGMVYDDGRVSGNGRVFDNGKVCDYGKVYGDGVVYGNGIVCGNGIVSEYGIVRGLVYGKGKVYGDGIVSDSGEVFGKGEVFKGKIIGTVSLPYKYIFQYQCENRALTAILIEGDEILYSIGCQSNITKETFLDRIHNENGGLEKNPHRKEYLKLIPLVEQYFKN